MAQPPKKPPVSPLSLVEKCDVGARILADEALPPVQIPGRFSTVSQQKVAEALHKVVHFALYPVHLKPTSSYADLNHALSTGNTNGGAGKEDPLSFTSLGTWKRIQTEVADSQTEFVVPVGVLLGSDGVCKEACILHLCDRIHCLALHLKEETEYSVTNLEHHDTEVLVKLCTCLLGPNSLVLQECQVGQSNVPHGVFDLVAGVMDKRDVLFTIGVALADDIVHLYDPVGCSIKKGTTLAKKAIGSQIPMEACVFDEVQVAADPSVEDITVFLAASSQTFRPFIRIKKHNLLLTTSSHIKWNDREEGLQYDGIVFLVLLILATATKTPVCPKLTTEVVDDLVLGVGTKVFHCGWNEYFSTCDETYEIVRPRRHAVSMKPQPVADSHPKLVDYRKFKKYSDKTFV